MLFIFSSEDNANIEEVAFEDLVFGVEGEMEDATEDDHEEILGPGVKKVTHEDDCEILCREVLCLSFVEQIKTLANTNIQICTYPKCTRRVIIKEEFVGSAMYLKWVCCFQVHLHSIVFV